MVFTRKDVEFPWLCYFAGGYEMYEPTAFIMEDEE